LHLAHCDVWVLNAAVRSIGHHLRVVGRISLLFFLWSISGRLTRAATYEEPLFRGFLWGYLKDRDWPERRVFGAVALLFWVGHLYCIFRAPVSFWFVVPLGSVILAYLAWRSRYPGGHPRHTSSACGTLGR
jgi:hypothetical protein